MVVASVIPKPHRWFTSFKTSLEVLFLSCQGVNCIKTVPELFELVLDRILYPLMTV